MLENLEYDSKNWNPSRFSEGEILSVKYEHSFRGQLLVLAESLVALHATEMKATGQNFYFLWVTLEVKVNEILEDSNSNISVKGSGID